ncbi:right-handed parallel beta-helix repeat-containing protein [Candidatus Bipolaricaulota bacterium]|nr:right-handed parallel beta-helix repeat-containing protein [Candidatus Bipolaricaulota bacterium]
MKKLLVMCVLLALAAPGALADRQERGPIVIRSNADFTYENGVIAGRGLPEDPYVIAGWEIEEIGARFGILIQGTTLPVVIRDVEIGGAKVAGIKIMSARNVRIEGCLVQGSALGIGVFMSEDVQIRDTTIRECEDALHVYFSSGLELSGLHVSESIVGAWFTGAQGVLLTGSTFRECALGVKLELGSEGNLIYGNAFLACRIPAVSEGGNAWDDGARGNYWEGFAAPDEDGDGILDQPYSLGLDEDRFPLATPPEG